MTTVAQKNESKNLASTLDSNRAVADAHFAKFESSLSYLSPEDLDIVCDAYEFAYNAHDGQMRKNGEPYITHPIAVAGQCAKWKLDWPALVAALLHDTMEDCGVTKDDISSKFSPAVAQMVDGLTKLDKLQFDTREEGQAESFRKMLIAMSQDVRVILVKIADRLHNMRTMGDMPRDKWRRISDETFDIYAPLANRMGLNEAYRELQDLAFCYKFPWRYSVLSKALAKAHQRRRDAVLKAQQEVQKTLEEANIKARVLSREKMLYSIYTKMLGKKLSFAQVTDIYGMRIVVSSRLECYSALGLIHQLYHPTMERFHEYIAKPKPNGYQSLHTTVVGPAKIAIEFQIRTETMDMVAESGIAAHWLYKTQTQENAFKENLGNNWLQSLLDIQNETKNASEFWADVRGELKADEIFVFTPKHRIKHFPLGSTAVDFAYSIHSSIGHHATIAKINGQQVPLRTELSNGDIVEISTSENSSPNPAWLAFVKTGRARSAIRSFLKSLGQDEIRLLGEKLLSQALRAEGITQQTTNNEFFDKDIWESLISLSGSKSREEMMIDIGAGNHSASMLAKQFVQMLQSKGFRADALLMSKERFGAHENLSQGAVILDGSEKMSIKYANCCRPVPNDTVHGYLGRSDGLIIHTTDCPVAKRLQQKDSERFITVIWADEPARPFDAGVLVTVINSKGVLSTVSDIIAKEDADIVYIGMNEEASSHNGALDLNFVIAVKNLQHLQSILEKLKRATTVLRVTRAINAS